MNSKEILILPTPKQVQGSGETIKISPNLFVEREEWQPLVLVMEESLSKIFECEIVKDNKPGITLKYDEALLPGEYRIEGTFAYASDYFGASYALATILQLIDNAGGYSIPSYKISDKADVERRSFMVDLARFWHPKRVILSYIDICFFYKIKYFQLHFMDNGCYTLPSKRFPLLPHKKKQYSYEDIREIRAYAKARGIVLVPEIEMPGHAHDLFRTYPEIFGDEISKETEEKIASGEIKDVPSYYRTAVCVGRKACMDGLRDLIDEVIELFPDAPYIHIGGDEAPHEIWNYCPVCQSYMKESGLKNSKELYCHAVSLLTRHVVSRGKIPMVWEGFPTSAAHLIPKETIVVFWDGGFNSAKELLKSGFKVINSSWNPMYIAANYKISTAEDILNWNYTVFQNKDKDAKENIIDLGESENIIGAQLCAWEAPYEFESNFVMENLMALSERLWANSNSVTNEEFLFKFKKLRRKIFHLIMDR